MRTIRQIFTPLHAALPAPVKTLEFWSELAVCAAMFWGFRWILLLAWAVQ